MEKFVIQIPNNKVSLVTQLLSELGVHIRKDSGNNDIDSKTPNRLTAKTIEEAKQGKNLSEPITDVTAFLESI